MAHIGLSDEEIVEFKKAFSYLDVNGDGYISKYELKNFMKKLRMKSNEHQLEDMMEEIDTNYSDTNATIDFSEFLSWMSKIYRKITPQDVKQIFDFFDSNGKGYITAKQVRRVVGELEDHYLTDEQIQSMIDDIDTTGKGHITFKDFCQMMMGENYADVDSDELTTS